MNTSDYKFAPNTPKHIIAGYVENSKTGLLVWEVKEVQGIAAFGPQGGVITEDKLTPAIAEFLIGKEEHKDFLIKTKK